MQDMVIGNKEKEILRLHYLKGMAPSKISKKTKLPLEEVKQTVVDSWKANREVKRFPAPVMKLAGLDYDFQDESWIDIEQDLIGFF